ncbi:FAD-binding domain-containing protein [Scheffersomyces xylosifermentans]|uniref:FAD-binding domain-containing protein n=1 Tax=Scheffersomyces xylosifermentans TaxID=1304137 RepID=UPI00315D540A
MYSLFWAALLVTSLSQVDASGAPYEKYGAAKKTMYACKLQINGAASFGTNASLSDQYFCTDPNARATLAGCYSVGGRNTSANIETFNEYCEENYNTSITFDLFKASYENYTKFAKDPSEIPGFNVTIPVDYPIKVNETLAHLYQRAYDVFLNNYDYTLYYGSGILGYWALVFILAAIANWSKILFPGLVKKFNGKISNTFRKHITLPATIVKKKSQEQRFLKVFNFMIPSRMETLVLVGFLALTMVLCAVNIYYVDEDPVFEGKRIAIMRYVADRTGITATIIMPLLILFAGRNNFLQWLTGWNFATFIVFHRWVARVDFILVVVHAVCFSIALGDYYSEEMKARYMIGGAIAAVAGGVIMVQGMLFLRRRWYEIFLLFHIVLALCWVCGAWIHVVDLGYVWFMYSAVAVWGFDRVVRLFRLASFGVPKADVYLLADETLKVIIPKPKYWCSVPGGHAFIHFIRPSCFWQSHPFTFTDSADQKDSIVLYCKVKGGVTHGLYQYLASHPGKSTSIRVAVEGPYGEPSPAKRYDSAVFVAGGNGIPGIYSEAVDVDFKKRNQSNNFVKLIWVVREYRSLYWFYEELVALKKTNIQTTVYITQPDSTAHLSEFNERFLPVVNETDSYNDESSKKEKKEKQTDEKCDYRSLEVDDNFEGSFETKNNIVKIIKEELSHINFKEGRPQMESLVLSEIEESPGTVAFVTCGHPLMVDDLRHSVANNLDNSKGKRVEFFEQLQIWS